MTTYGSEESSPGESPDLRVSVSSGIQTRRPGRLASTGTSGTPLSARAAPSPLSARALRLPQTPSLRPSSSERTDGSQRHSDRKPSKTELEFCKTTSGSHRPRSPRSRVQSDMEALRRPSKSPRSRTWQPDSDTTKSFFSRVSSPRQSSRKNSARGEKDRTSDACPDSAQKFESIEKTTSICDPIPPVIRLPSAMKAIQSELMVLQREFSGNSFTVDLVDCDIFNWELAVVGPERSPYQNGIFRFLLSFPPNYPEKLPRVRCATPVYHCNIDQSGNVCMGSFGKDGGSSPQASEPKLEKKEVVPSACVIRLRVTIISARGLRNADSLGLSDPFCTCHIPGKNWTKFQTAVIDNQLSPIWNEEHVINDYVPGDPIEFNVLDEDAGDTEGDLLGRATLASTSFYPEGFEGDVNLSEAGKGHRAVLRVKVSVLIPRQQHDRATAIDIVEGLLSLLTLPVLESPLVPSVANMFKTDRRQHDRLAREWTLRHAL